MAAQATPIPFGDRLRNRLADLGDHATQAWLSKRSGIDSSLISRIMASGRAPTLDTLQALAPALELDVADLVSGTDAEFRLAASSDHVRLSDYQEAVGKVIEYESKIRDLEARARSQDEAFNKERSARLSSDEEVAALRAKYEQSESLLAEARQKSTLQQANLDEYKIALKRAISEFSALKSRIDELQSELGKTGQSSKVNTILAGIAAVASFATMAHFLGKDEAPKRKNSQAKKPGGAK
jgi:transcriptional regulator with XRE-family HTH domain